MRILAVTSSYPRDRGDIAGRFVWEMNRALERRGHRVEVATWRDGGTAEHGEPLPGEERVARVGYAPKSTESLFYGAGAIENLQRRPGRIAQIPGALGAMFAHLLRRIGDWEPDLLVGHWMVPAGMLVRLAESVLGVPSLIVAHSGGVHVLERLPSRLGRLVGALFSGAQVVATSEPLREKLQRLAPDARCAVLPMGYPSELENGDHGSGAERGDVLYMGRFAEIKGPDLAIEAGCGVLGEFGATLRMAGRGPMEEHLRRRARRAECDVALRAPAVGAEKRRLLSECSAAVFPSKRRRNRHEGLPVSLLEAAAAGVVPFVGTIPGAEPILANPEFQVLGSAAPTEWSRRLRAFGAMSPVRREELAAQTRKRVRELAWPRVIGRWERRFNEAIDPPRGAPLGD